MTELPNGKDPVHLINDAPRRYYANSRLTGIVLPGSQESELVEESALIIVREMKYCQALRDSAKKDLDLTYWPVLREPSASSKYADPLSQVLMLTRAPVMNQRAGVVMRERGAHGPANGGATASADLGLEIVLREATLAEGDFVFA